MNFWMRNSSKIKNEKGGFVKQMSIKDFEIVIN